MILALQPQLEGRIFRSPEGVALRRGPFGLGLIVMRPVRAGEAIYQSDWFTVPNADHSYRVLVEIDGSVEEVRVTRTHSVKYHDARTFDIPGCFQARVSGSVNKIPRLGCCRRSARFAKATIPS